MKNPFNGGFKILAEDHPELLLSLLGLQQPGAKTQITNLPRELHLDPIEIDHAYLINGEHIIHFEAITNWAPKRLGLLAVYHLLLRHKYKLPVFSYVVLMAEKYAPKAFPDNLIYEEAGGLLIQIPYKVIRLWEVEPAPAFEAAGAEIGRAHV